MTQSRRTFLLGACSLPLIGCGATPVPPTRTAAIASVPVSTKSPAFDAWVDGFKNRARNRGISANTINAAFRNVGYLPAVIDRDRNQFHVRRTVEDYVAISTVASRLAIGNTAFARERRTLNAVESRYGVPAEFVAAIWGVESAYGTRRGTFPVISALSTLGFASRRAKFFESQLVGALKILQNGDTTLNNMVGSWAGAMGHTQFIPTTYLSHAVDFDGDGRRDVWAEDPGDALASAASYLRQSGWSGSGWGFEVRVPSGVTPSKSYKKTSARSFSAWSNLGVRRADGSPLPASGSGRLVRPDGNFGAAFLLRNNFSAILRYNNSDKYGIAVGHLSDRFRGDGPLITKYPPDQFGFLIEDRILLQKRLAAKGYYDGATSGAFGRQTDAAIRAYQAAKGLPVDGKPSRTLLNHLR